MQHPHGLTATAGHRFRGHQRQSQSIREFVRASSPLNALTIPLIYSLAVPLVVLDLWVTLYQRICFPIYGVARVERSRYLVFDRHRLGYLNAIEKVHCIYCSYATGVLAYAIEVAGRTEDYWCPIKHAVPIPRRRSNRHFAYGDAKAYHEQLAALRQSLSVKGAETDDQRRAPLGQAAEDENTR